MNDLPEPREDPCKYSLCGPNSQCTVNNNSSLCSCLSGFIGNPPSCRPECVVNSECPTNLACYNTICVDPCVRSCGVNTTCIVTNHKPICICDVGYIGDSFSNCYHKQPGKFLGNIRYGDRTDNKFNFLFCF